MGWVRIWEELQEVDPKGGNRAAEIINKHRVSAESADEFMVALTEVLDE